MIRKNEILAIATETGLDKHVVEKDYMLGWLLAGIRQHEVGQNWAFKGGTCLTKCYFDTYRFSEDLDFTVNYNKYLDEKYLHQAFTEIGDWIYENTGVMVPEERLKFDMYENPRGMPACQGRIYYRGPASSNAPKQMPRIKLDLTADERVVDKLVVRPVRHPYSDRPENGIEALCYSYAELFAEKIRALSERTRPRDLYDVINLYRRPESVALINDVRRILKEKCAFKNIPFPSYDILLQHKEVCLAGWNEQLSHQLPVLPPSDNFWNELPQFFEWLSSNHLTSVQLQPIPPEKRAVLVHDLSAGQRATVGIQFLSKLDKIRFAASNHLLINLLYEPEDKPRKNYLVESYALYRTSEDNLILRAVKHDTGESRSFRLDRMINVTVLEKSYVPKYRIELLPNERGQRFSG